MNYRMIPIEIGELPHTGRLGGDNSGYRDVAVSLLDAENPDPLVKLPKSLARHIVYADGDLNQVCHHYGKGFGASGGAFLRQPMAEGLLEVDRLLKQYDRRLLVLDAWRSVEVQARLWVNAFWRIWRGKENTVDVAEIVSTGLKANEIVSYAPVMEDLRFQFFAENLDLDPQKHADFESCVEQGLTKTTGEAARLYQIFQVNLKNNSAKLKLDETANTAHGSGGAVDVFLINTKTGKPSCLGVPFGYKGKAARMDYFENPENFDEFKIRRRGDPELSRYLYSHRIGHLKTDDFTRIMKERRILFHTMKKAGASFYLNECWHFQLGNERGGHQAAELPGAGNSCHSLLKNVRDRQTNTIMAVWGNAAAHNMAKKLLA